MREKETYTITSDAGIPLAIIPASFMELYKTHVYKLLRDDEKPERILVNIIESESKTKAVDEESVNRINEFYKRRGFITVSDYIVYRMCEFLRDTLPICRNCSMYMASANGYCFCVGAAVQENAWACENFSQD